MAEWNSIKMAQHFLRLSNSLNPDEARQEGRYEEELARQELLDECYMSSFSKPGLIEMLQRSITGDVKLPDDLPENVTIDADRYKAAFVENAKAVLREVEK